VLLVGVRRVGRERAAEHTIEKGTFATAGVAEEHCKPVKPVVSSEPSPRTMHALSPVGQDLVLS
jgi:hypothetical protein